MKYCAYFKILTFKIFWHDLVHNYERVNLNIQVADYLDYYRCRVRALVLNLGFLEGSRIFLHPTLIYFVACVQMERDIKGT